MVRRIIDTHTHPLLDERQRLIDDDHSPARYWEQAESLGVERAAALVMAPRDDLAHTRELNDRVLELARDDTRYFAVCSVHPLDGVAALDELERVTVAGATWLKLHPNTQDFDVADPAVVEVVSRAGELGLPVLFDAYSPWDPAQPGKFVKLALAAPGARLILAHAHGPDFSSLLVYDILQKYPWWDRRVWIDISATVELLARGPYAEQFVWVLRKVGVDRILFASDYPMVDVASYIDAVASLGFDEEELDRICYLNALDLLDVSTE